MPIYGFRCEVRDEHTEEHYYPLREVDFQRFCEVCGGRMFRDLTVEARNHVPASTFPYVTTNITGKPITIESPSHLRTLEKLHGVRLRDDAEYIDEQLSHVENKVDYNNGNPKLRTTPVYGGGRGGGSGCRWV